ncbi:hypothetical protein GCM10009760_09250 [Kitasatospora kazusensis]|uniref:Uncharacterized protein n=1 Tax=Kitasatospora kazusensis TaxID=407974 RepID=A0ABN2YVZ3_9ACTN
MGWLNLTIGGNLDGVSRDWDWPAVTASAGVVTALTVLWGAVTAVHRTRRQRQREFEDFTFAGTGSCWTGCPSRPCGAPTGVASSTSGSNRRSA